MPVIMFPAARDLERIIRKPSPNASQLRERLGRTDVAEIWREVTGSRAGGQVGQGCPGAGYVAPPGGPHLNVSAVLGTPPRA